MVIDKMIKCLDGKHIASLIRQEIAAEVAELKAQGKRPPCLAVIIVGHDGGSEAYVANKVKACEEVGFISKRIAFEDIITEAQLLEQINLLNNDNDIDGFIVQLPLPRHINEQKVIEAIDYHKDVDGLHPINMGKTVLGLPCMHPATPSGIIELLNRYDIQTEGKHAVVIGRSDIVGKPIANMLLQKAPRGNATVTVCHSRTPNLAEICRSADILIAALGKPLFVKADMVKDGAVVIDVGTTRIEDPSRKSGYRLCGDVDFDNVAPKCSYITPVPGGVGPMTIASLLRNTLQAYKRHNK